MSRVADRGGQTQLGQEHNEAERSGVEIAERSGERTLGGALEAAGSCGADNGSSPSSSVARGASCAHDFVYRRWLDVPTAALVWQRVCTRLDCCRPLILACRLCGESYEKRCGSARASKCRSCAQRHRKDVAAVGRSGWLDSPADMAIFMTLTAVGELPEYPGGPSIAFDRSVCGHVKGVDRCSGKRGCRSEVGALARWHDELPLNWSHFVQDLRRVLGIRVEFYKTYEPHDRGALHAHVMVRLVGVCSEDSFRAAVKLCAPRNGFGRVFDVQVVDLADERSIARTAGYCSAYAAKCADALPNVLRISRDGEFSVGGLRSWSSSWGWGDSMKSIRARRVAWVCSRQPLAPARAPAPASEASLDLKSDFYASRVMGCSSAPGGGDASV